MSKVKRRRSPLKIILKTLLGIILALLLAAAVLLIIPLTETADPSTVTGSDEWMSKLPSDIGLNEIILPGTHDSASKYVQLAFVTKCQSMSVEQQLDSGFRYFDIRLGVDEDQLKLMHGFTNCKTGPTPWDGPLYFHVILDQCYSFLREHPTETIVLAVKQEYGDESVAEFENLLNAYVQKDPEYWLKTDKIPQLYEARGKIVLMRRYNDEAHLGAAAGIPLLWENQDGFDDVSKNTAENPNGSYTLWVQDRYEYNAEDKWNAFIEGMKKPENGSVVISFLSTKGTFAYGHPYKFAKTLNDLFMEKNDLSGWIILDFGSTPLAEHIYSKNFGG